MHFRKHREVTAKSADCTLRDKQFCTARGLFCTTDADTVSAFILLENIQPKYTRYTINASAEFLRAKPAGFVIYSDAESTNDLAEILAYHNVIDYQIDSEHTVRIGANSKNVYIYCPRSNVLVDFAWADIPTLSDLSLKLMITFGLVLHKTESGVKNR